MISIVGLARLIWTTILSVFTGMTSINTNEIAILPEVINESSGLIMTTDTIFWSINDSGGRPVIYAFNKNGEMVDSIVVPNAKNIDWEALTTDPHGNIYIGDVGNNSNNRKDLKIYILPEKSTETAVIEYHYPDQKNFSTKGNFDMEGFFYYRDSLYLFSKNKIKGTGYSKIYSLPATAGKYAATLIDSIYTGTPVTGAAIAPNDSTVALMSYGRMILITDFEEGRFHTGKLHYIKIPITQTEAVTFAGNDLIYYTDEGRKLHKMDLGIYLSRKKPNKKPAR